MSQAFFRFYLGKTSITRKVKCKRSRTLRLFCLVGFAKMFNSWISVSSGTRSLTSLLRQAVSFGWLSQIVRVGTTLLPELLSYLMDKTVARDSPLLGPQGLNSRGRPLTSLWFFLLQGRRMLQRKCNIEYKCIKNKSGCACGQDTSLSSRSTRSESPSAYVSTYQKKGFHPNWPFLLFCFGSSSVQPWLRLTAKKSNLSQGNYYGFLLGFHPVWPFFPFFWL